jgi:superfamily I DNA/RNA helicase
MIKADQLTEEQKHFIFEISKKENRIWLKGYAGSGKSILLVHTINDKIVVNSNVSICIVVFTHSLIEMFSAGMKELAIPEKNVYLTTYHQFRKTDYNFDYIFCDEVQDLTKSVLENMKSRTEHLIVAGDSNQSIYKSDPATGEPVVISSDIGLITGTKPYELEGIHRLSKSIVKIIDIFLPIMNIFKAKILHKGNNTTVRLANSSDEYKEVDYILSNANDAVMNDSSVVIILPTHNEIYKFINIALNIHNLSPWNREENLNVWGKPDYSKLHQYLDSTKLNIEYIGNGYGDLYSTSQMNKIVLMTYHSAKGLDFDNVFLPFMHERDNWFNDNILTKTLFMVGMTRSKNTLYLTYTGTIHHYINSFENECTKIDIDTIDNDSSDNLDFDF